MSFRATTFFQPLVLMVVIVGLAASSLSAAKTGDERDYRALISGLVDRMGRAVNQVEADGDVPGFFASAVSIQQEILGESVVFARDYANGPSLRDFAAPTVKTQLLDLNHFREHQKKRPPSQLNSSESRSFSRLMGDVMISLKADLADSRLPVTKEGFVDLLVAHNAAVVDMAKIFLIFEEDSDLRSVVQDILSKHQIELNTLRKIKDTGHRYQASG